MLRLTGCTALYASPATNLTLVEGTAYPAPGGVLLLEWKGIPAVEKPA
jgi:hypothetical protein